MGSATTDRRMGLTGDKGMKAPVDLATTTSITLSGEQTIDGALTSTSRVMVKNQSDSTQNGIYDSSTGTWTRTADADGIQDVVNGTMFYVSGGATQSGRFYVLSGTNPVLPGSSAITFSPVIYGTTVVNAYTATAGQTAFTLSSAPGSVNNTIVTIDGIRLTPTMDYTLSGTTLTIPSGVALGYEVLVSYQTVLAQGTSDAASASYLPSGTGAITTSVQAKLRESVSVKDFGAVGDGVTDDTAAIQAAIDYVVYRNLSSGMTSGGSVYIPGGIYKTSNTIHLGYGENFHSVLVYGDGKRYRCQANFAGTGIVPTFSDRPVFAISGGRNSEIRGLSILGKNYTWISSNNLGAYATPTLDDLVASNWVDTSFAAAASSQYAPYCAIAIDPYAGTAPATAYPNVTFPAWSGISTQYGKAYSSMTVIEDVGITGFVVGVANQPCNADGNGDFTKLVRVDIECCQYAISVGNTQSRLVHVVDGQIQNVHTGIVTGINGKQLGQPGICFDNTTISFSIYWMNVPTLAYGAGLTFRNCYAETLYSLGTCGTGGVAGNSPVAFESCQFGFASWDYRGIPTVIFSTNSGASFRNCRFDPGLTVKPNFFAMDIEAENLAIDNCIIDAGSAATKYYEKHGINATGGIVISRGLTNVATFSLRTMYHYNLNTGASLTYRKINQTATLSNRKTCIHIYAKVVRPADVYTNDGGFTFTAAPFAIDKTACTTISTSVKTVTVDLTGAIVGTWQLNQSGGDVGDVIWDDETKTTFVVSSRTGSSVTLIAQTNLDSSGNLKVAPTKTSNFYCINCRLYTPTYYTLGDLSTASTTVANFQRPDAYAGYISSSTDGVQINDYVFAGNAAALYKQSPTGGTISAIGANSITMGAVANYTQTKVRMDLFVRASPANGT